MLKYIYTICLMLMFSLIATDSFAGNPDRQGEAGAPELIMNPWARSAGLHGINTSSVRGVEAMRLNVAGISRINTTDIVIGHTRYLEGTGIKFNAAGIAQKVGKNGVLGISLMQLDFGDIPVTTTGSPEGTGATFSPNYFNLGLGYSHTFENKVSVGLLVRMISESIADVSAFGFAFDAGVQYVAGPQDNFKFGISLRNIGSPLQFKGEGLTVRQTNPSGEFPYLLTYEQRTSEFELPSALNIGVSYDIYVLEKNMIRLMGNFTSNSFSRDLIGAGLEYWFNEMFGVRGAYNYELGTSGANAFDSPIYTGLAAGFSFQVPLKKGSSDRFGIDYAYRHTKLWSGTHNISVRVSL